MRLAKNFLATVAIVYMCWNMALQQSHEKKLGGIDVLVMGMDYLWNNGDAASWRDKVFDCLLKIFDFGTEDNQTRFAWACGSDYRNSIHVEYISVFSIFGKNNSAHPNYFSVFDCTGNSDSRKLQGVLAVGAPKINDNRPNASLVTIVLSDNTLEDTILTGPAAFFAEGKNVLLNLYKMDNPPASANNIDKMAGGRNRAKVINILDNGAHCDSDEINHVKIGLCSPLHNEILNKTTCAPVKGSTDTCVQLVTFDPQLQRADLVCTDLLLNNLESCACPTTTTIATTADGGTTAANTGIISIIVYCAAGLFVLLAIGIGIYFVCRKKSKQQIAAENAPNKTSASGSKVSTLTALGVWNPQISPTSTIDLESIEKINPRSVLISPKIGKNAPPVVAASLSGSKVGPKKSATPVATLKVKMNISQVKMNISQAKMNISQVKMNISQAKMNNSQSKTSKISTCKESQSKTCQINKSTKSKMLPVNAKISRV